MLVKRVIVTVMVDHSPGHTTIASTTLKMKAGEADPPETIIANAAKNLGLKAWYGDNPPPTPTREGGRA